MNSNNWMDIRKAFVSTMARIDMRFRSGNSVSCERAHITAEEWKILNDYEDAAEDLVMRFTSRSESES